jgi:hypothetical protein
MYGNKVYLVDGGLPLVVDGKLVGAVAAVGTPGQDEECAQAGIAGLGKGPSGAEIAAGEKLSVFAALALAPQWRLAEQMARRKVIRRAACVRDRSNFTHSMVDRQRFRK